MTEILKSFLITTPESDDAVFYCSVWSTEIIKLAEDKGFDVVNLSGSKAKRNNFESYIEKKRPEFVMFNGHGLENEIAGHENEVLLQKDENDGIVNKAIIYARSCFALRGLGASCVRLGAMGFVGYGLPFAFVSDPNRSAHPLKDTLAEPCFVSSNIIPLSILKGQTISEAVAKSRNKMKELMEFWETREDLAEAPIVAVCLYWNQQGLGFEGDPETRLPK